MHLRTVVRAEIQETRDYISYWGSEQPQPAQVLPSAWDAVPLEPGRTGFSNNSGLGLVAPAQRRLCSSHRTRAPSTWGSHRGWPDLTDVREHYEMILLIEFVASLVSGSPARIFTPQDPGSCSSQSPPDSSASNSSDRSRSSQVAASTPLNPTHLYGNVVRPCRKPGFSISLFSKKRKAETQRVSKLPKRQGRGPGTLLTTALHSAANTHVTE